MTNKPVALRFQIELELELLVFEEGGKQEKNPRSREEDQQQLNLHDVESGN